MSCDYVVSSMTKKINWKDSYNDIPDEEKMTVVLKILKYCSVEMPKMKVDNKNVHDCTIWNTVANNIYKDYSDEQSLKTACQMYNQCIAYARANSQELIQAYANKSAVLFRLKKYEGCLEAVNTRLKFVCSKDWKMKMFMRKAQCLTKLKREEAAGFIEETKQWVKDNIPKNKQVSTMKKLDDLLVEKKGPDNADKIIVDYESLPNHLKPSKWNAEVPSMSSSVTLKYKSGKRYFEAARTIRPGEVIAKEISFWKILYTENKYNNCWGCLKELENCIPCDHCVQVMFCSERCKKESWDKFHDVECAVLPYWLKMTDSRRFETIFIASLRMAILGIKEFGSIAKLRQNLQQVDLQDPRVKGFSADGMLYSDSYKSIHGLNIDLNVCDNIFLTRCLIWSCLLVHILANETKFFLKKLKAGWSALAKNNDVVFIASLLFKNAVFAVCENFNIDLPFTNEHSSGSLGIDVSPTMCLMTRFEEHPNAQTIYKGDYHIVIAINRIEKGDEIKLIESEVGQYCQFFSFKPKPWWQRREKATRFKMNEVEQQLSLIDLVEYKMESDNMESPNKVVKMLCETQDAIEFLQRCKVSKVKMVELGDVISKIYKKYVF